MTTENSQTSFGSQRLRKGTIVIVLALGAFLRIWNFPASQEVRDWDEIGYVGNGLMAWEGLSPGWGTVPAGPETWVSWLYAAGQSGIELLKPQSQTTTTPRLLKPYLAVDQALFKTYEDLGPLRGLLLGISVVVALAGVFAGYRLGEEYGGAAGGLLLGGLVAVLPLYVGFCAIAKSCSDAWMYAVIAIACATIAGGTKRFWLPGIFLGLAIASRIDMLIAVPMVLWALWNRAEKGAVWKSMFATLGVTLAAALIAAPFAVTGFLGILRNIATTRVIGYWPIESPRLATFNDLAWDQGLGPVLLATIAGLFVFPSGTWLKRGVFAGFTALMAATMFDGRYMMMRYHGGPILALLVCAALAIGALFRRLHPKLALAIAAMLLALPLAQSIRMVMAAKAAYVPENSTEWVDKHVPPQTIVYLSLGFTARAVLPTAKAADRIWDLVSENEAWRTRLHEGLERFSLPEEYLPRALSEANLDEVRGVARRWFILGGGRSRRPRFDVRPISLSPAFGLKRAEVGAEFKKTGGVLIWRTAAGVIPAGLGEPFVQWVNSKGDGTMIFVSPDVREKLIQPE